MINIFNNPIINRYRFSLYRPLNLIVAGIIYCTLVMVISVLCILANIPGNFTGFNDVDFKEISRLIYYWLLGLETLLLWIMASSAPATVINTQIIKRSQDFFELLPLSGFRKTVGILVGTNLIYYPFVIINFLIMTNFAVLGGVRFSLQFNTIVALLCVGIFFNSFTLLVTLLTQTKKPKANSQQTSAGLIVLLPAIILGITVISNIGNFERKELFEWVTFKFYQVDLPIILFISFWAVYFSVWNIFGSIRKLQQKSLPLFSPLGATLFFIGCEFLITGFFYPHFQDTGISENLLCTHGIIGFILLVIIVCSSLQSRKRLIESINRIALEEKKGNSRFFSLFRKSNLFVPSILLFIWTVIAIGLGLNTNFPSQVGILHLIAFIMFCLFIFCLNDISVLIKRSSKIMSFLFIFFGMVVQILPLVIGVMLQVKLLIITSFLGYAFSMFSGFPPRTKISIFLRMQAVLINIIISLSLLIISGNIYLQKLKESSGELDTEEIED